MSYNYEKDASDWRRPIDARTANDNVGYALGEAGITVEYPYVKLTGGYFQSLTLTKDMFDRLVTWYTTYQPFKKPSNKRRFECRVGAYKFWEVEQDGRRYKLSWGKIGTPGMSLAREKLSTVHANQYIAKLIREKKRHGYVEVM